MFFYTGIAAFIIVTLFRYFAKQKHRWKGKKQTSMDGKVYLRLHRPPRKNQAEKFFLGIPATCKTSFMIFPEKNSNAYLKKIGLCNEFQTGDTEFDRKYFISCDETSFLEELRLNKELRKLIDELFTKGAQYVICSKNKIWFETSYDFGADNYPPVIELLEKISAEINKTSRSLAKTFFDKNNIIATLLMSVHSAALIFGGFALFMMISVAYAIPDKAGWIKIALPAGILFTALWCAFVVGVLKNSSRLNLVLTDFVISGIAGFMLLTFVTVYEYNMDFDHNPRQDVYVQVYDKHTYKCGKRNRRTCYKITIEDWQNPGTTRGMKVSSYEYNSVTVGGQMRVTLGSGALGIEYVDNIID